MIVTILPNGNGSFHAVGYNEHKVKQGKAQLLEISNFGAVGKFGAYTTSELVDYLKAYTSSNDRIKKPQFHIAVSCKGHEMTEQQLVEFAHKYLDEMGYGQKGQPLLIYAHRDTENTHIHIITSRIDPHGKKIDHNKERIRSQQVVAKLMGEDIKKKTEQDIEIAKGYSVSSLIQFKTVLNSLGYEAYDRNDTLYVKRDGRVQVKIPLAELELLYKKKVRDTKRNMQLKAILMKYRDLTSNKEELKKMLKKNFGIDIILFGKKDTPTGYSIVDHKNKTVLHGNSIIDIKKLLDFSTIEDKLRNAEDYIRKLLDAEPKSTPLQICWKIKRTGMYITKGKLYYISTGQSIELPEDIKDRLNINYRIERVEKFHPTTEKERDLLCKMFKIEEYKDSVELSTDKEEKREFANILGDTFMEHEGRELRAALRGMGINIKRDGEEVFAIDFNRKLIINLSDENIDIKRLDRKPNKPISNRPEKREKAPTIKRGRGMINDLGHSDNREWEVHGRYGEVDDHIETGLKY